MLKQVAVAAATSCLQGLAGLACKTLLTQASYVIAYFSRDEFYSRELMLTAYRVQWIYTYGNVPVFYSR